VPGSLVLVGGEPGVGKSTLLLQACAGLCGRGARVLYVTGEESPDQVRRRAGRVGEAALSVPVEPSFETVLATVEAERPAACVIDPSDARDRRRGAEASARSARRPALLEAAKRLDVTMI
jgi:DNA repair protein RadA/Sms